MQPRSSAFKRGSPIASTTLSMSAAPGSLPPLARRTTSTTACANISGGMWLGIAAFPPCASGRTSGCAITSSPSLPSSVWSDASSIFARSSRPAAKSSTAAEQSDPKNQ